MMPPPFVPPSPIQHPVQIVKLLEFHKRVFGEGYAMGFRHAWWRGFYRGLIVAFSLEVIHFGWLWLGRR